MKTVQLIAPRGFCTVRHCSSRPALERIAKIHADLEAGRPVNSRNIAERLEVSAKTAHRDLEFMRDRLNLPIVYDPRNWSYRYTKTEGDGSPSEILRKLAEH